MKPQIEFIANTFEDEDYSIYEAGTTQRRIGPYHGVNYIPIPKGFVRHRWTFRDTLGALGCDILEVFFYYLGDEGLFPSYQSIANNLGVSPSAVYQSIKNMTTSVLTCPVCGYTQLALRKKNRMKGKEYTSSKYNIQPILDFLQHVDESHWKDENNRDDYFTALEKYRAGRKKSDF